MFMKVNFNSGADNSLMRLFKIADLISAQVIKKEAQSEAARKALEFQLQNEPQTVDTVSASTTYSDEAY